jgi:hypothetical protein
MQRQINKRDEAEETQKRDDPQNSIHGKTVRPNYAASGSIAEQAFPLVVRPPAHHPE